MKKYLKNDYIRGAVILGGIVLFFFSPVVLGRQTLFEALPTVFNQKLYDFPYLKLPWTVDGGTLTRAEAPETLEGVRLVRSGEWPLWTPYVGAGQPLSGYPVSGLYNPIRLILFSLFPLLRTFDFFILIRIFLAGFGVFLFLKELGISQRSSLLGGIAYMLSGYFMTYITLWFVAIDVALPYVFWAIERYFKSFSLHGAFLVGLCWSFIILGSQPQASVAFSLVLGAYFLYRMWTSRASIKAKRALLHGLAAFGIALLIALPLIVDFSVFLNNLWYDHARGLDHLSWPEMLHLIVSPSMFLEIAMSGGIYRGTLTPVPYLGISVLILALFGLTTSKQRYARLFFVGLAIFFVLKIVGFPLLNWIGVMPVLNQIIWVRLYAPIALSVAVLAAIGFEAISEKSFNVRRVAYIVAGVVLVYVLFFFFNPQGFERWYVPQFDIMRRPDFAGAVSHFLNGLPPPLGALAYAVLGNGWYFAAILFSLTAVVAVLTFVFVMLYRSTGRGIYLTGLFILVVSELFLYIPKIRDGLFHQFNPYPLHPAIEFLQQETKTNFGRFIAARDALTPHTASIFGLYDFRISTITPTRYRIFSEAFLKPRGISNVGFSEEDFNPTMQRFFDLASIQYIASEAPLTNPETLDKVFDGDLLIYKNPTALPRAYLASKAVFAPNPNSARAVLEKSDFDYTEEVVLEHANDSQKDPQIPSLSQSSLVPATIQSYSANRVVIEVSSRTPGFLVLTDAYYPGWKAYVDGKEVPIYPANVMFRAVLLPSGQHLVEFRYKPWWVYASVFVAVTSFAAVCSTLIRKRTIVSTL